MLDLPGEEVQLINADHLNICKFESPSDSNYCILRNAFVSTITSIEKTYLLPRILQREDQMKALSRYLGLVESPTADLANAVQHQVDGSCTWLTDSPLFLDWQEGLDRTPRCYLLSGEPASGKSTIAGHVVKYLEECACDCSYFFFQDDNTGKSTVAELLCSMAWQMALSNTTIREKLLIICEEGVPIDKSDERSIWRTLFTTLILRTELCQPQYWVIDALDECVNYATLTSFLAKIDRHFILRVFMTSRVSMAIERSFAHEGVEKISDKITLEASLRDIKLFLQERASYLPAESKQERQHLMDLILEKSNGNFLWTSLVVKGLEDAVSREEVNDIQISIPQKISDSYAQIVSNIMAEPRNRLLAKAILRWTLCASRPLLVEELKEALRLDIGETLIQLEKSIYFICGNLVFIDTESRVQIAHQTVREFFFQRREDFEFALIKSEEHARISDVCLNYLSSEEMKPPRFRHGSRSRLNKVQRSAFSAYAIVHFSDHLVRATSSDSTRLATLSNFLMNNSLSWIEAVAVTQDLAPIIQTAKNLSIYLEKRKKYIAPLGVQVNNVSEWADDLIYLVAQFGKIILASPQAIYHLTPPICPQQSIIFRTFKSHPRGLQVVGLSQHHWDDRVCSIIIPGARIFSVASRDNRFALGGSNGRVYIYQETTFQEKQKLVHGEPVHRLAFTTTNTYLAASGRRKISLWNTLTGQLLWSHQNADDTLAIAFNDSDTILFAAMKANYVVL
jgi:hypothetical protein